MSEPAFPPLHAAVPPRERVTPTIIPAPNGPKKIQPTDFQGDGNHGRDSAPKIQETGEPSTKRDISAKQSSFVSTDYLISSVIPGLLIIHDGIQQLVQTTQMTLRETRHAAFSEVHIGNDRLEEERKRLKFFERKLREVAASDIAVTQEYERARAVLAEAKNDQSAPSNLEEKKSKDKYLKNCEMLVKSWTGNVEKARERVAEWEFKSTRQVARVGKLTDDAHAADVNCRKTCHGIDKDIKHLEAVAEFLKSVGNK